MKIDESKLLILFLSIILGFLLASQMSFGKITPRELLTSQSYQQMTFEIRKLRDEIDMLKDKKKELQLKLLKYEYSDEPSSDMINNLSQELEEHDLYIGFTDVKGPGVVVSLSDNPNYGNLVDSRENSSDLLLVHDRDILEIVGDLKAAGAEAISVNDQRIIYKSDIFCGGPIIFVNDVELVPPYVIKAIGDPESLSYALGKEDSYYKWLDAREVQVNFKKEENIKILKYDKNIYNTYAKPVKD